MKITVFGGAFDPPHYGHQQIIASLFKQGMADEVWLVPTGVHDFDKKMQSAQHRIAMLKLLIAEFEPALKSKIKIETCELNRTGVSQTYDTLTELASQHPEHLFAWIMGSDNLAKFHLWENYDRMLAEYPVYIYPRFGFDLQPLYQGMIPLSGVEQIKVSSTLIKEKLAQQAQQDLVKLLPSSILAYLQTNKLYSD